MYVTLNFVVRDHIYHINRKESFGFKRRIDMWENYQYYNEMCPHSKKYVEVEDVWDILVTKMVKQDDWRYPSNNSELKLSFSII
jgi:hypothetical protein